MRMWNRGIFDSLSELANAPEEEREAALAEASRRSVTLLALLAVALLMFGGVCGFTLGSFAGGWLARTMRGASLPFEAQAGAAVRIVVLCIFLGCAAWLMLRLRRAILIRVMRRMRRGCVCPSCGYSLVGIRGADGFVSCPECAASVSEVEVPGVLRASEKGEAGATRLPKAWGNRERKEAES